MLLIAIVGLATIAKDGKYYDGSNPEHRSSLSTKMNVTQAPAVLGSSPLERVARIFASKPRPATRAQVHYTPLPVHTVDIRLSFSRRSPPAVVSL